ncbi:MAG TPA: DUF5997 family protein [Marmoricola sp.]|nr:DUF5997 family protein [Marmoricola sp.]
MSQSMKPEVAAKKLGVHFPATPDEFRSGLVTREQFNALQAHPPQWLIELRANGPHPRSVVAGKLGISNSGLARAGVSDSMTTAEIQQLLVDMPEWLEKERATQAEVRKEKARLQERSKN